MSTLKDFPYRKVLVLGLAKSGSAAAKLLHDSGVDVCVNDLKANQEDDIVKELKDRGINVVTGSHPSDLLDEIDLIVKNPGIPYDNPLLQLALQLNLPIITEVELAGRLIGDRITGITGSNGKTTTTTLVFEMMKQGGKKVKAAGNIGEVASEVARYAEPDEHIVMELSSFQLMGIDTFKPKIALLLNLFEAHLDYHKSFENYKEAKANIFKNQTAEDYLVFNADDSQVAELAKEARAVKIPFSTQGRMEKGAWMDEKYIYFEDEPVIEREEVVLVGKHNIENILAAICAAKLNGVNPTAIKSVLRSFSGVKHRLQYVTKINERAFYNDSKATNILATSKALAAFQNPVVLLAGGLDRGNEFDELIPFLSHVKAMVLFGETAGKLKKSGEKAGIGHIEQAADMEEAVRMAFSASSEGDTILLSPACASWDQYSTFEERGDQYISAVNMLAD